MGRRKRERQRVSRTDIPMLSEAERREAYLTALEKRDEYGRYLITECAEEIAAFVNQN
jgi:hypothetical protein